MYLTDDLDKAIIFYEQALEILTKNLEKNQLDYKIESWNKQKKDVLYLFYITLDAAKSFAKAEEAIKDHHKIVELLHTE